MKNKNKLHYVKVFSVKHNVYGKVYPEAVRHDGAWWVPEPNGLRTYAALGDTAGVKLQLSEDGFSETGCLIVHEPGSTRDTDEVWICLANTDRCKIVKDVALPKAKSPCKEEKSLPKPLISLSETLREIEQSRAEVQLVDDALNELKDLIELFSSTVGDILHNIDCGNESAKRAVEDMKAIEEALDKAS